MQFFIERSSLARTIKFIINASDHFAYVVGACSSDIIWIRNWMCCCEWQYLDRMCLHFACPSSPVRSVFPVGSRLVVSITCDGQVAHFAANGWQVNEVCSVGAPCTKIWLFWPSLTSRYPIAASSLYHSQTAWLPLDLWRVCFFLFSYIRVCVYLQFVHNVKIWFALWWLDWWRS